MEQLNGAISKLTDTKFGCVTVTASDGVNVNQPRHVTSQNSLFQVFFYFSLSVWERWARKVLIAAKP